MRAHARRSVLPFLAAVCAVAALAACAGAVAADAATVSLAVRVDNNAGPSPDDGAPSWGRVTSVPAGIDCPTTCSADFDTATPVTLTATATAGYELLKWNAIPQNPGCAPAPTCTLRLAADDLVTASFQPSAQLSAVPAGHGSIELQALQPAGPATTCDVAFQQEADGSACTQRYPAGARVKVTAHPDPGARIAGWSDYGCVQTSLTCVQTLQAGDQYVSARFDRVTLAIQGSQFGAITIVSPAPSHFCALIAASVDCKVDYKAGTLVTLRRQHPATGPRDDGKLPRFWVGGCLGNTAGVLDAQTCQLRLQADELVGAGYAAEGEIPPALGSGIAVTLGGNKRGVVTGAVINGSGPTLSCGSRCVLTGLDRYDRIRVTATGTRGSHFVRWSDGSTLRRRILQMSRVNRIQARFGR